MFPVNIQRYLENEDLIYENTALPFNGRAFLFDYKNGDFLMENGRPIEVTGKRAVEAWLEKLIRTAKFRFEIYEDFEGSQVDYAVTIEDLIGGVWPKGFVEAEIEREIKEAAVTNTYIDDLINWEFEREGSLLKISFTVLTILGEQRMEVTI